MHGLPAHAERLTDLLPGPAVAPRAVHLEGLQPLDQLPQGRHGTQAHTRVLVRGVRRRIDCLSSGVNLH